MGHGDAGLDAELVGFPGFTLADAFDFRCMQSVELVFVPSAVACGCAQPVRAGVQLGDDTRRFTDHRRQFAFDFAQDNAKEGALTFDRTPQTLELFGMGVAAGLATQRLAFFDKGLLQGDADALCGLDDLGRAISSNRLSTGWAMAFS